MKKFLLVLCMITCLFGLTACDASDKNTDSGLTLAEEDYKSIIRDNFELIANMSDAELDELRDNVADEGQAGFIDGWKQSRDDVGVIGGYSDWAFTSNAKGGFEVSVVVAGSEHDLDFKMGVTKQGAIDYTTFAVRYSLGEKMVKAALNTVIGMGLVFVVLVFISFIIDLFKYISIFEQKMKDKKSGAGNSEAKGSSVDNTISQIVQKEEEELMDDLELVAVIAAAIAAAEGTSPDGLVVRSIKKVNKKRWQNA